MEINLNNKKKGFIRLLVIIIILILVLSYFSINIKSVVESPTSQSNFSYVWGLISTTWNKYLAGPASYLWNDIFKDILWASFVNNMERVRDGKPTDFELYAPQVP